MFAWITYTRLALLFWRTHFERNLYRVCSWWHNWLYLLNFFIFCTKNYFHWITITYSFLIKLFTRDMIKLFSGQESHISKKLFLTNCVICSYICSILMMIEVSRVASNVSFPKPFLELICLREGFFLEPWCQHILFAENF